MEELRQVILALSRKCCPSPDRMPSLLGGRGGGAKERCTEPMTHGLEAPLDAAPATCVKMLGGMER